MGIFKNMDKGRKPIGRFAGAAALVLGFLPCATQAQFTYTTNSPDTSTITITKYTGAGGSVDIPATIGGRTVTVIGATAFASCSNVTGVTIPGAVKTIGFAAFQRCSGLTNVAIPASVTVIDTAAFNMCGNLTSVALPGSVTNAGNGLFAQCFRLTNIAVSATNPAYRCSDGVLFDIGQTRLIQCPGAKNGDYAVPDGVVRIETMAFAGCSNLTSIALPNSVAEIGDASFNMCAGLTSLTIPAGVSTIGQYAFAWCTGMTQVYFCGNAPLVGQYVLSNSIQAVVCRLPCATGWPTVPDAWGNQPTALWLPQVWSDEDLDLQGNPFGFHAAWAAGKTVVVDTCTSLAAPDWQPLQTNVLADGTAYFSDAPQTSDPRRFYRLRSP